MLYEFAIIPDVFDSSLINANPALSLTLVELLRGISENGLIANLHKGAWIGHIRTNRIADLSPALKDKVITCLDLLEDRHRLVRHPRSTTGDPANESDWLTLALDSHNRIAFQAIILSDALLSACGGGSCHLGFSTVLDSPAWLKRRRRSLTLHKTITEYRQMLAPTLRHAKSLSLVDPYMNAYEERYKDMLDLCSNLMGNRTHDRLPGRIHIHTDPGNQKPEEQELDYHIDQWRTFLTSLAAHYGHRFRVFFWRSSGGKRFHDRFILTDQCGISVPAGLDVRTSSNHTTTWSLLDEEDRRANLDEYAEGVSPFYLVRPPLEVP